MYHPDDPFDRRELELETLLSTPKISPFVEMTKVPFVTVQSIEL